MQIRGGFVDVESAGEMINRALVQHEIRHVNFPVDMGVRERPSHRSIEARQTIFQGNWNLLRRSFTQQREQRQKFIKIPGVNMDGQGLS